jgi:hypothetical protein
MKKVESMVKKVNSSKYDDFFYKNFLRTVFALVFGFFSFVAYKNFQKTSIGPISTFEEISQKKLALVQSFGFTIPITTSRFLNKLRQF